jgi:2-oxoisovalerate dehydrogenase E2 component (dihydrolipoyl transacylase)
MHHGKVVKLHYKQGEIAKVHAPLFAMDVEPQDTATASDTTTETLSDPSKATAATTSSGTRRKDFILPDIGEGIVECELVEWLVKEGDWVEEDQPVADVMTDKALVQIPCMDQGRISKLYYKQGEIAKVHGPLFEIEIADDAQPEPASVDSCQPQQQSQQQAQAAQSSSQENATVVTMGVVAMGKALASPAVRRIAREHDVDISQVKGSGKDGRVLKSDIQAFVDGTLAPSAQLGIQTPSETSPSNAKATEKTAENRVEPIRGIKAAMAKQMIRSVSTIPHFTYAEEMDITDLITLRKKTKSKHGSEGRQTHANAFLYESDGDGD